MSKNLNAHFIILIATFLVGGSFIISQKLSGIIDPISITLLRFVIASLLLAPIVFLNQKYREKIISTFKRAMIISFFYSIYFIGMFKALEFTTALNTGTIFTLVPLLTALFSIFVFKQKISFNQYLIYLIGIIGTCMVIFKGNLELFLSLSLNKGDVIFIFSTFCMALYSISAKHFHRKDDELVVLVFMTLVGGIIWMSLALVLFGVPLDWQKISSKEFLYLGYLTVFATLVTSYLYQKATIVLGPKKVMAYVYLNPGAIAILLFVFELKSINFWMFLGILISSFATLILLKKE
ncbi:DMT family transporter [Aliarcobacter butzleri]|uniref:DMT family transporter n=1 Tax=Aliarcobacter butzleri TaxID=28197 RepID=UPI0021B597A5|nr:DMT family transporter [Aliarcobacter butzleri]MCT7574426.1 DMT family transporter [Aliarcobacter butzleri]